MSQPSCPALVHELVEAVKEGRRKTAEVVERVSAEDREATRQKLVEAADLVRRKYLLSVPETRRFLHELLDVSI